MASTLNVRGMDDLTMKRIRAAAGARDWTLAQYLNRIAQLHHVARQLAREDPKLNQYLDEMGLATVVGVEDTFEMVKAEA